jgi:hypothetical protein
MCDLPLQAISTLRVLSEQVYLAQCTSACQTEGVLIEVTAAFIGVRHL